MGSMKQMEMHAHSDPAVGRKYIAELVPLLEHIQAQPAFSCSLSKTEKADLVKFAADLCLVNAAGATARWGKALHETLMDITNVCTCIDHHPNVAAHSCSGMSAKKTACIVHCPDVATHLGIKLCAKKSSRFANQTRHAALAAHGTDTRKQQYAIRQRTIDKYQRASASSDSPRRHAVIMQPNCDTYRGADAHIGNDDIPQHEIKGAIAYSGRIRKVYAKPIDTAAAMACSMKEEHPNSTFTTASQIEDLQQLIPGGTAMIDPASLLEETGLYILALQMQVHSLHALLNAPPSSSSSSSSS